MKNLILSWANQKRLLLKAKKVSRWLILLTAFFTVGYFLFLAFWLKPGNPVLFGLLLAGEIFHVWLSLTYLYTIWGLVGGKRRTVLNQIKPSALPAVDVFITVAGEPEDVVEKTVRAATEMEYSNKHIFILNDGRVLEKDNWRSIESLAARLGVECITRTVPGGAKAGNINHALKNTHSPFVAILDADHIPHSDFLNKTLGYFRDANMAFVQTPQYYRNHASSEVAEAAWHQQAVFFGPICQGKSLIKTVPMCGTNMVIRRQALEEVGGMCQVNIAEDFLTGMFLHERGWKSVFVPEILAEGLAPEDLLSYVKQQFRWARGSLEVVFTYNPLWRRGLSWRQKLHYLSSASYFLSGPVVLINACLPVLALYFGFTPLRVSTMSTAAVFLPYMLLTLYVLHLSTNFHFSFKSAAFAVSSFALQTKALLAVLMGSHNTFSVTAKNRQEGNFIWLAAPHLTYIIVAIFGLWPAISREGFSPMVITNFAWAVFNIAMFVPFIRASLPAKVWAESEAALPARELRGA